MILFNYFSIFSHHPVYSGATADFYQEGIVAALAVNVNGYLLEDGNFIFRFVAPGYEKMVLTSNTGNIISSGFVEVGKRNKKQCQSQKCIRIWENRWKEVPKWTNNNMEYSIKNFKGYGGNRLIYLFFL